MAGTTRILTGIEDMDAFRNVMEGRLMERTVFMPSGCWEWTGFKSASGYGITSYMGKRPRTHCVSYLLWRGEVPDGLQLDHLCRNRACLNPEHLEAVTSRENTLRGTGPTALSAVKTHCLRGHEFNAENTRINRSGRRICRPCARLHLARWRASLKAAAGNSTQQHEAWLDRRVA